MCNQSVSLHPLRIGIATGKVMAGYSGTQQRATYTCIGNTVNMAGRLEVHTKVAGRGILIDDDTQRASRDRFRTVVAETFAVATEQPP